MNYRAYSIGIFGICVLKVKKRGEIKQDCRREKWVTSRIGVILKIRVEHPKGDPERFGKQRAVSLKLGILLMRANHIKILPPSPSNVVHFFAIKCRLVE